MQKLLLLLLLHDVNSYDKIRKVNLWTKTHVAKYRIQNIVLNFHVPTCTQYLLRNTRNQVNLLTINSCENPIIIDNLLEKLKLW